MDEPTTKEVQDFLDNLQEIDDPVKKIKWLKAFFVQYYETGYMALATKVADKDWDLSEME